MLFFGVYAPDLQLNCKDPDLCLRKLTQSLLQKTFNNKYKIYILVISANVTKMLTVIFHSTVL
jgi:hypothetical protein